MKYFILILILTLSFGCEPQIPSPYYEGVKVNIKDLGVTGTIRNVWSNMDMVDVSYVDHLGQVHEAHLSYKQLELVK